ncbi:hypothetical protein [Klebsiella oxytoca]|uniref:hypothetical protein n=1 Tax=Klebsiella oxytoca TaxID=571 RepID=UPI0039B6FB4C
MSFIRPYYGGACSELLCDCPLTLALILTGRALLLKMDQTLTELKCELVWCFAAELKAPRWLRTASGVKFIDGEGA